MFYSKFGKLSKFTASIVPFPICPHHTRTMAKEKPTDPEKEAKRAAKASKKEAKRSETNGVHKSKSEKTDKDKKDKKDKKEKKEKKAKEVEAVDVEVTTKLLNSLDKTKPGTVVVKDEGDLQVKVKSAPLLGALVPFANPLADEKVGKKVLKSVKKGTHIPPCPN